MKRVSIKAYTYLGEFLGEIQDADFVGFSKVINQGLGDCTITLARKFDDVGVDFAHGNKIEIFISDKETIADETTGVKSQRIYAGQVKRVRPVISGNDERVEIQCAGYGILLGLDVLKNSAQTTLYTRSSGGVGTTSTPENVDIGSVVQGIIDRFRAERANPEVSYTIDSIPAVGTNMTYTFEQRTYREALEKCLAVAPYGYYWYLDENGVLYFDGIESTPTHKFIFGKHFSQIEIEKSIENMRNAILIWNGDAGGGAIYKAYTDAASIQSYGRRIERLTDSGIGDSGTMDLIGSKFLAENSDVQVKFVCEIIDNNGSDEKGYDIESIRPGQTCSLFNFKSSVASLVKENMIITQVDYTLDSARVTIEPIRVSISDISERLKQKISEQTSQGMPATYS